MNNELIARTIVMFYSIQARSQAKVPWGCKIICNEVHKAGQQRWRAPIPEVHKPMGCEAEAPEGAMGWWCNCWCNCTQSTRLVTTGMGTA